MDINQMVRQTTLAIRRSAVISNPYVCRYFARGLAPSPINDSVDDLWGFTEEDKYKLNQYDPDDELDEDTYDMKRKLGRLPGPGEYVIRVSLAKGDVRIVRTLSEKRQWDSESLAPAVAPLKRYMAVLDPDGIHARVELDPNSPLVKRCPNCLKLISMHDSDVDIALSSKAVFCSFECKKQYAIKKKLHEEEVNRTTQERSRQTQNRLEEIRRIISGV